MTTVTLTIEGLDKAIGSGKSAAIEAAIGKGLMAVAMMAATEAKTSIIRGAKTGRIYKRGSVTHQASAPGESPANDLGNLVNSIKASPVDNSEVDLIADAPYAAHLEYGTRNMEPRPFMQPAVDKVEPNGAVIINAFVNAAMKP